jgi:hypothetical protein
MHIDLSDLQHGFIFPLVMSVLVSLAIAQSARSQCTNVNLLTMDGWEELLASGNVWQGDWPQLIDCVFDWIDADNIHRLNGAESDDPFYVSAGYSVSNAPLRRVTELLLVKGFDRTIVYGGTNGSGRVLTGIIYLLTAQSSNGVCDCDEDSMPDWYEDGYGFLSATNPADAAADEDSDFLPNSGEYEQGTDPVNPDTDGDRMLDGKEVAAGTKPTDDTSFLGMEQLAPGFDVAGVIVQWQSVTGKTYALARTGNLIPSSPFSILRTGVVGQAQTTRYTDTTATAAGPCFYRAEVEPGQ